MNKDDRTRNKEGNSHTAEQMNIQQMNKEQGWKQPYSRTDEYPTDEQGTRMETAIQPNR